MTKNRSITIIMRNIQGITITTRPNFYSWYINNLPILYCLKFISCNYIFQGLGKRRFRNNSNKYQSDFLAWSPNKQSTYQQEANTVRGRPPTAKHSVYKIDFHGSSGNPIKPQYTPRPKTSFDEGNPTTTTYRYSHGSDNPNKSILNAMSNTGLSSMPTNKKVRSSSARFATRDTVASCMSWYRPPTPRKTVTSENTIVPHPPPPKTAPASVVTAPTE